MFLPKSKKVKQNKKPQNTRKQKRKRPFPDQPHCPTTGSFQVLLHIHKKFDLCMLLLGVGLAPQRDGEICDCSIKAKRKQLSQQQPWRCFQCLLYLENPAKPCLPSYGFSRLFPAFPFNIRTEHIPRWVRRAVRHAQCSVLREAI